MITTFLIRFVIIFNISVYMLKINCSVVFIYLFIFLTMMFKNVMKNNACDDLRFSVMIYIITTKRIICEGM